MADASALSGYDPIVACQNAPFTVAHTSYTTPIALRTIDDSLGKGLVSSLWNDGMLRGKKDTPPPSTSRKRQSARIKGKIEEKKMKECPRLDAATERKESEGCEKKKKKEVKEDCPRPEVVAGEKESEGCDEQTMEECPRPDVATVKKESEGGEDRKSTSSSTSVELRRRHETPSMSAPDAVSPARVGTISMVVDRWEDTQVEQLSAVHRILDFPWRLRLFKCDHSLRYLSLECDKSKEAELWQCCVSVEDEWNEEAYVLPFSSWKGNERGRYIALEKFKEGTLIRVQITTKIAECVNVRPILNPFEPRDGIFVIGEGMKRIYVNKQSLSSQSSFFEQLFLTQSTTLDEFPIKDVEYEEFSNILNMVYGLNSNPLSDCNARKILLLARRFELKIVEDRVINYLLSSSSSMNIHQRFLIADQFNIHFLKMKLISLYTKEQLKELSDSPEWNDLSCDATREIMKRRCSIDTE